MALLQSQMYNHYQAVRKIHVNGDKNYINCEFSVKSTLNTVNLWLPFRILDSRQKFHGKSFVFQGKGPINISHVDNKIYYTPQSLAKSNDDILEANSKSYGLCMAESNSHVCLFTYKRVVSRSISQIEDKTVSIAKCDSHVAINYSFMTFAQVDLLNE